MSTQLPEPWQELLQSEFDQPYFHAIRSKLVAEINAKKQVFPPPKLIFNAFNQCPLEKTKVVILGQDPYHSLSPAKDGGEIPHAHGLSFSIPPEATKIPPSLQNIYKEIQSDLGHPIPSHGNLQSWANQGVLLLNASLSVEAGQANSHKDFGWHQFTDRVIEKISAHRPHVVFILWGSFAQSKAPLIDEKKHLILKAVHPSPLSAHNGFFGCGHFSKANNFLWVTDQEEIDWQIS